MKLSFKWHSQGDTNIRRPTRWPPRCVRPGARPATTARAGPARPPGQERRVAHCPPHVPAVDRERHLRRHVPGGARRIHCRHHEIRAAKALQRIARFLQCLRAARQLEQLFPRQISPSPQTQLVGHLQREFDRDVPCVRPFQQPQVVADSLEVRVQPVEPAVVIVKPAVNLREASVRLRGGFRNGLRQFEQLAGQQVHPHCL